MEEPRRRQAIFPTTAGVGGGRALHPLPPGKPAPVPGLSTRLTASKVLKGTEAG